MSLPISEHKRFLIVSAIICLGLTTNFPKANAQDSTSTETVTADGVLESIVVTAQRRSQDLQSVPIAIQAFDEERLETLRIRGFDDLQVFTPALTASPNPADSTGIRLSLRGIGQDDPQIGLDATVGLYVNGVYVGKTPGLAFDAPDLERVEVLKGPQGTLYGRNAVAGAINIVTKGADIGEDFSADGTFQAGNFGSLSLDGSFNFPLGETAALRVSGLVRDRDGYVENNSSSLNLTAVTGIPGAGFRPQGEGSDFGGVDRRGINADFGWQIAPNVLVEYGFDRSRTLNEPFFQQLIPNEDGGFGFLQAPSLAAGVPLVPVSESVQRDAVSTVPIEETRADIRGHRLALEFDWHEDHSTKLLGAYRRTDVEAFTSFFPELNPFVLGGTLAAGTLDPTLPANPQTNSSLLDTFAFAVPALLNSVDPLLPATDLTVRPDFAVPFTTPFAPPLFGNPFVSFGTSPEGGFPTLDDHEQFSIELTQTGSCLLYTSPSPRDATLSRMPSSA